MSQFEFIFVLVSIVIGLALTRILDGLSQVIQRKVEHQSVDFVHLAMSIFTFVVLIQVWWTWFRWESEHWDFYRFLVTIIHSASIYAISAVLYPRHANTVPAFIDIRVALYSVLAVNFLLEILYTYEFGALFSPWYYLPTTGHLAALCLLGIVAKSRKVDVFISAWFLFVGIGWPFVVRFTI